MPLKLDRSLCGHYGSCMTYPVVGIREIAYSLWVIGFGLTFLLYPLIYHDLKKSPCPVICWAKRGIYCAPFFPSFSSSGSCGWSKPSCLVLTDHGGCLTRFLFLCLTRLPRIIKEGFSTYFQPWPFQQSSQRPLWKWPKACCNCLSWQLSYGWKLFFVSWF